MANVHPPIVPFYRIKKTVKRAGQRLASDVFQRLTTGAEVSPRPATANPRVQSTSILMR